MICHRESLIIDLDNTKMKRVINSEKKNQQSRRRDHQYTWDGIREREEIKEEARWLINSMDGFVRRMGEEEEEWNNNGIYIERSKRSSSPYEEI